MPHMPNDVQWLPSLQVQARQASSLMRRGTAVASDGHAFESVDNWDDLGPDCRRRVATVSVKFCKHLLYSEEIGGGNKPST